MKSILITSLGVILTLTMVWTQTPEVAAYSYKNRELNVRTTAYTHTESDHTKYGRKTALGTNLKFTQEYTSAASDWSRFPVGTEFRIKGLNRHFVIDDYGSALLGKDTIDLYFTSKSRMNRWGVQHVDIIITKYGDFEKSREILSHRVKYAHCKKMLDDIDENRRNSEGLEEFYESVPPVTDEIDTKLMAAASIPKKEWELSAPEILPDPKQPAIEHEYESLLVDHQPVLKIKRMRRPFRQIFATSFRSSGKWTINRRHPGEIQIPIVKEQPIETRSSNIYRASTAGGQYEPVREKRKFRPL